MPYPSKFTDDRKKQIIQGFRKGWAITHIAESVEIPRRTLYKWLKKGQLEGEGEYADFYNACRNAQEAYWEKVQYNLEQMILTSATTKATVTTTTTTTDNEGNFTEKVVVKEHLPNPSLALEILSRRFPEKWNKVATLQSVLDNDIHAELIAHGFDPDEIMINVSKVLREATPSRSPKKNAHKV